VNHLKGSLLFNQFRLLLFERFIRISSISDFWILQEQLSGTNRKEICVDWGGLGGCRSVLLRVGVVLPVTVLILLNKLLFLLVITLLSLFSFLSFIRFTK